MLEWQGRILTRTYIPNHLVVDQFCSSLSIYNLTWRFKLKALHFSQSSIKNQDDSLTCGWLVNSKQCLDVFLARSRMMNLWTFLPLPLSYSLCLMFPTGGAKSTSPIALITLDSKASTRRQGTGKTHSPCQEVRRLSGLNVQTSTAEQLSAIWGDGEGKANTEIHQ